MLSQVPMNESIKVEMWDEDKFNGDDKLGVVEIDIANEVRICTACRDVAAERCHLPHTHWRAGPIVESVGYGGDLVMTWHPWMCEPVPGRCRCEGVARRYTLVLSMCLRRSPGKLSRSPQVQMLARSGVDSVFLDVILDFS